MNCSLIQLPISPRFHFTSVSAHWFVRHWRYQVHLNLKNFGFYQWQPHECAHWRLTGQSLRHWQYLTTNFWKPGFCRDLRSLRQSNNSKFKPRMKASDFKDFCNKNCKNQLDHFWLHYPVWVTFVLFKNVFACFFPWQLVLINFCKRTLSDDHLISSDTFN